MAGLSSLVLLAVLARAGREMYGYEIAKAVKAEGEGGLIFKQGAIYPVLRSLNALGLLESRVEASAFGPRPNARQGPGPRRQSGKKSGADPGDELTLPPFCSFFVCLTFRQARTGHDPPAGRSRR